MTVNPTWLQDARRVFPVRVDLPIVTAYAAVHTGTFGTVSSCAPTTRAPQAEVVVGAAGGCTYHGQVSFDTTSLPYDTPIVSATLRLYTPAQTPATGVQVYPNAAPSNGGVVRQLVSWEPPNWASAPALSAGTGGVAQSGSDGHWQSWDVTTLVRQWVQNAHTNGGLTLVGSGAPVAFASPLGAGSDSPAGAPSLDITYAPRSATATAASSYSDSANYIYGVSGEFAANCSNKVCNSKIGVNTVGQGATGPTGGYGGTLYGAYIRVGAVLDCAGGMPAAQAGNSGSITDILNNAQNDFLIPIVDFLPNDNCLQYSTPGSWNQQVTYFANHISSYWKSNWIYFEIGNEPSTTQAPAKRGGCATSYGEYGCSALSYANIFAAAAQGLQSAMGASATYRVLTGGMLQPTAYVTSCYPPCTPPCADSGHNVNIDDVANAINEAEASPYSVAAAHLGVAVHPYKYNTSETTTYWKNYFNSRLYGANGYAGICGDLGTMLNLWTGQFSGMPVVFTEDNWSDHPTNETNCPNTPATLYTVGCEGTYLVDLFTWLQDHNSYALPYGSPVRLAWFTGADFSTLPEPFPLGIYTPGGSGGEKYFTTSYCPYDSNVAGNHSIANDFYELDVTGCY